MADRYSIVPGDPRVHKSDVLALAARNLPARSESRYTKYYERNPVGPPVFFLAQEAGSGKFVGMAALFPTRLRIRGELVPAAMTGDFAIDADHRGFGPALPLQRELLTALADRKLSCGYGSPNKFAEAVIQRVGWADLGKFTRFVKVLRTEFVGSAYPRARAIAPVAAAAGAMVVDPTLAAISRERRYRRPSTLSTDSPDAFDERFSDICKATAHRDGITVERSRELLNWKYPTAGAPDARTFSIFALVDDGSSVAGYIVYRVKDNIRHIFDIDVLESETLLDALLAEFILDARENRAAGITLLYLGAEDVLARRLRAFGFLRRRDEAGVRVHVPQGARASVDLLDSRNWRFFRGYNDI